MKVRVFELEEPRKKGQSRVAEGLRFSNYVLYFTKELRLVRIFVLKLNEVSCLHRLLYL